MKPFLYMFHDTTMSSSVFTNLQYGHYNPSIRPSPSEILTRLRISILNRSVSFPSSVTSVFSFLPIYESTRFIGDVRRVNIVKSHTSYVVVFTQILTSM